ncbi:94f6cb52-6d65-466b-a028-2c5ba3455dbb [Sclerotinia trifoliorum]|uniref:94f6cb52-6d65-466b-a028-2c5ba3455dbb n=1 Tax=Sclerotinia trifoliorum TaxID=28548 RepID=A0A8H2VL66_9HELO|nr:94f6cb52-6d65-466b-a028-2c5ba3455dbb [Sclerotinia trifoliorum]
MHILEAEIMTDCVIDPAGDFKLNVTQGLPNSATITFVISRNVLKRNSTNKLADDLRNSRNNLTLTNTNIIALETILRIIHGVDPAPNTVGNNTFDRQSLVGLYHVLDLALKWFETAALEAWFDKFWADRRGNELTLSSLKSLLYPCFAFRHPGAFGHVTRALVLECNGDDIHGLNPITGFAEFRVPNSVLGGLARVKNRILGDITNHLLSPLDSLCHNSCRSNGLCIEAYESALTDCLVGPYTSRSHSIQEILESEGVESWMCNSPRQASRNCSDILSTAGSQITAMKIDALSFWDGMCIDCVLRTSECHADQAKYWIDGQQQRYGESCMLAHGYQTWIYSYMGPPELMSRHLAEQNEREEAAVHVSADVLAPEARETATDVEAEDDYDPEWDLYD